MSCFSYDKGHALQTESSEGGEKERGSEKGGREEKGENIAPLNPELMPLLHQEAIPCHREEIGEGMSAQIWG